MPIELKKKQSKLDYFLTRTPNSKTSEADSTSPTIFENHKRIVSFFCNIKTNKLTS